MTNLEKTVSPGLAAAVTACCAAKLRFEALAAELLPHAAGDVRDMLERFFAQAMDELSAAIDAGIAEICAGWSEAERETMAQAMAAPEDCEDRPGDGEVIH